MTIQLKPHRLFCYFAWFVLTPLYFLLAFTAPHWCERFWALGGWGTSGAVVCTEVWLALLLLPLILTTFPVCVHYMAERKW